MKIGSLEKSNTGEVAGSQPQSTDNFSSKDESVNLGVEEDAWLGQFFHSHKESIENIRGDTVLDRQSSSTLKPVNENLVSQDLEEKTPLLKPKGSPEDKVGPDDYFALEALPEQFMNDGSSPTREDGMEGAMLAEPVEVVDMVSESEVVVKDYVAVKTDTLLPVEESISHDFKMPDIHFHIPEGIHPKLQSVNDSYPKPKRNDFMLNSTEQDKLDGHTDNNKPFAHSLGTGELLYCNVTM